MIQLHFKAKSLDWFFYDGNIESWRVKRDCSNSSYYNCT